MNDQRDQDCREDNDCTMNQLFKQIRFFGSKLEQHMKEEGSQYKELNIKIDTITEQIKFQGHQITAQSKQIREQSETINSMMIIFKAFPETEEGVADIHGHRDDHISRMTSAQESKAWWKHQRDKWAEKAFDGVVIGVVLLIGYGIIGWLQATTNVVVK